MASKGKVRGEFWLLCSLAASLCLLFYSCGRFETAAEDTIYIVFFFFIVLCSLCDFFLNYFNDHTETLNVLGVCLTAQCRSSNELKGEIDQRTSTGTSCEVLSMFTEGDSSSRTFCEAQQVV